MNLERCQQALEKLHDQVEMYERIMDSIYNGIMVTDAEGYITHFNKPYGEFLGLEPKEQIGRHCTDSIENSRMHIVARTGKAEINLTHRIQGQDMVVQRIPIRKNGKVIAVFGQVMFKDVRDVSKLAGRLSLLESKIKLYEQELITLRSTRYTFESIIGNSRSITRPKREAFQAAANQFPILITGESGTGKELFAQAIHHGSTRRIHPFVRINCAAIPKDLLESELFGYERGAFTGARAGGKPGKFELAHRGTVFLDEIGDLPLEMQPKLLRVLEDREFERIGGTKPIRSDFRLISATNQDLDEMIAGGRFRKDLFYRLNVIPLYIPPLRERRGDIIPIARQLLKRLQEDAALESLELEAEAEQVLRDHDWPGNVREISNVRERTLSVLDGVLIRRHDLPFYIQPGRKGPATGNRTSIRSVQAQAEKKAILFALQESGYNKARAAKALGIHRTLLYKKMRKHGISLKPDSE